MLFLTRNIASMRNDLISPVISRNAWLCAFSSEVISRNAWLCAFSRRLRKLFGFFVKKSIVVLSELDQLSLNNYFHKFSQQACEGDVPIIGNLPLVRYENGLPDFVEKHQHGFLGFGPIQIRNPG
ncbi:unnamed protein product [Rodentolepis nana]|uniref:ATP-binding protein n=1 Tax=Rodentolepis nana TaxID=102285 RepID=A0A0R3TV38_RODNA|nr:unnamed protein product [Rodentolepis nana]